MDCHESGVCSVGRKIDASERAILTVILAVKDASSKQLNGCIWSIASLKLGNRVELIIVSSGIFPGLDESYRSLLHSIRVIETEPRGVYNAYNVGLNEKLSEYVLFFGVDDLVLPGLDRVLEFIILSDCRFDLIAAYALMQDRGLSGPSRIRGSLIFRNWCQQGLIYNSKLFRHKRFDEKYRMQADHKFNLEMMANRHLHVAFRRDVISHFSSGGLSSLVSDWVFRADMPDIVKESYGRFYWLVAIAKRKIADIIKWKPPFNGRSDA